jgi:shikimate kinase
MKKSNFENFTPSKPIVLIGMMGAGKSSVGKALAEILCVPFCDADNEIIAISNCSIAQIFADYGEDEFRRIERQVIARLLKTGTGVLSVGGGAFMDDETRMRIKESALSVWLKVDRAILLSRVLRHGERPLLKEGDPREKMMRLLDEREPVYAEADLVVDCDDRPVIHTAKRVAEAITLLTD